MINNYLKIAFRALLRNGMVSLINILGLSLGMISCLLIFNYITYELSYDKQHANRNNIYRISLEFHKNKKLEFNSAQVYPALGPALKREFPEIQEFTRLRKVWSVVSYEAPYGKKNEFLEDKIYYADPELFKIFSWKIVTGNATEELKKPNTAVISKTTAKKFFGEENPVGKLIKLKFSNDYEHYTVAGVFEDVPENTHLKFNIILSYRSFEHYVGATAQNSWTWFGFFTYVLTKPGTNAKELEAKMSPFMASHNPDPENALSVLHLQKLTDIHLTSHLLDEAEENGSKQHIYFFMVLGILVIVVAWINYINTTVSRMIDRTREMGVRKVLGASKKQMYALFISESLFINVLTMILSLVLVLCFLPRLNSFLEQNITLIYPDSYLIIGAIIAFFLTGALLSGVYPALVTSSFHVVNMLKGKAQNLRMKLNPGKALLLFQYITSVVFISVTICVFLQLRMLMERDKGFNMDKVICLRAPSVNNTGLQYAGMLQSFKNSLLTYTNIRSVAASDNIPGEGNESMVGPIRFAGASESESSTYRTVGVDFDYFSLYKIPLLAGRTFSKDFETDITGVILNEQAVAAFGIRNPAEAIDKELVWGHRNLKILGVVKGFNQMSAKQTVDPLLFFLRPANDVLDYKFISIRSQSDNLKSVVAEIEGAWTQSFPGNPFEYFFVDDYYNRQFRLERQFSKVFGFFAFVTITIAALGLIGLLSLAATYRRKEITMHRVLGASFKNITWLLARDYFRLIVIAILSGLAVSTLLMNKWLDEYAVRIKLDYRFYILPALIVFLLTISIIIYQVVSLMRNTKPVTAIKGE